MYIPHVTLEAKGSKLCAHNPCLGDMCCGEMVDNCWLVADEGNMEWRKGW